MNAVTAPRCNRCGRKISSARSIEAGYGRTCKAKVAAAAKAVRLADVKPEILADAELLIEDGGIIAIRGNRVFRTVGSDGENFYLTAPQACTCKAGLKGRYLCFHRVAASILTAA